MAAAHRDIAGILKRHGYTELHKIGEGSFGFALLVQAADGSKLVCKMVDISRASRQEAQEAVKEGKLLAQFKHPYIVRYKESWVDGGWLSILMDYCEGGDLTQRIKEAKKARQHIPEESILRWFTQAVLALKHIHDKHILHRDIKPGNFFLTKDGTLKMGDFGIAKVLSCTLACARTQIGTPYYLSPEVCDERPYTWPSDIWALGCILYEMCALRVPFDGPNIPVLVQKIMKGNIPAVPAHYSEFMRTLCSEMLRRDPEARPSPEEILQRPQIQETIRQMLDEAQAHAQAVASARRAAGRQVSKDSKDSKDSKESSSRASSGGPPADAGALGQKTPSPSHSGDGEPSPSPKAQVEVSGPYASTAGSYRRHDLVEYHSVSHKDWLAAMVTDIDGFGDIMIDLKPTVWIPRREQATRVRPRRSAAAPGERHQAAAAVPAPSRAVAAAVAARPSAAAMAGASAAAAGAAAADDADGGGVAADLLQHPLVRGPPSVRRVVSDGGGAAVGGDGAAPPRRGGIASPRRQPVRSPSVGTAVHRHTPQSLVSPMWQRSPSVGAVSRKTPSPPRFGAGPLGSGVSRGTTPSSCASPPTGASPAGGGGVGGGGGGGGGGGQPWRVSGAQHMGSPNLPRPHWKQARGDSPFSRHNTAAAAAGVAIAGA